MSDHGKHEPEHWEERIQALLDGELGDDDAESLKSEATHDQRLARDIVEAYQLQQALERLGTEPAPVGLRRRLKRIPREHGRRPLLLQPRWVSAFAIVPLVAITLALLQPQQPSRAEIEQAAAELAVAFAYIDRLSRRTAVAIEQEVGGELSEAVGGSVIKSIPQTNPDLKETQA